MDYKDKYWHFRFEFHGETPRQNTLVNLTFKELKSKILLPWHSNEDFRVNKSVLKRPSEHIREVEICWTPQPTSYYSRLLDEERDRGNRESQHVAFIYFWRDRMVFQKNEAVDFTEELLFGCETFQGDTEAPEDEQKVMRAKPTSSEWKKTKVILKKLEKEKRVKDSAVPTGFQPVLGLVVAADIERRAAVRFMKPPKGHRSVLKCHSGNHTFYVGRFASHSAVLVQCANTGSVGPGGAMAKVYGLLDSWPLKAIIMPGITFGRKDKGQRYGDVLVSRSIAAYDSQRYSSDGNQYRADIPRSGKVLYDRMINNSGWRFAVNEQELSKVHKGVLLSGEGLIDNEERLKALIKQFPTSIGGEMEGVGLEAAADAKDCEWIVVKGVCDWAYGKEKSQQPLAAAASLSFLEKALSSEHALSGIASSRDVGNREKDGSRVELLARLYVQKLRSNPTEFGFFASFANDDTQSTIRDITAFGTIEAGNGKELDFFVDPVPKLIPNQERKLVGTFFLTNEDRTLDAICRRHFPGFHSPFIVFENKGDCSGDKVCLIRFSYSYKVSGPTQYEVKRERQFYAVFYSE